MRFLPALAAVPLLATVALVPVPAATGAAGAASSTSPIRLWMPSKVVVEGGGGRIHANLGVQLIAQGAPFELWSQRADYDSPVVTEWRNGTSRVRLPARSMTDFSGIRQFLKVTVTRPDGTEVLRRTRKACLASWMPQRLSPTAVARSPYPRACAWHPFTLGSVQGIPQDYAVPLEVPGSMRLGPGRYRVQAAIDPRIAEALGVAAADATATSTLVVPRPDKEQAAHEDGRDHGRDTARGTSEPLRPAAARPSAARAGAPAGPLPDLRSLPSFEISLNAKQTQLRFAATFWNAGNSPLVIDGFRNTDDESLMDAYQYFFDAEGTQTGHQRVGSMKFHGANHNHWHYQDLAEYSLVDADKEPVATSRKISFCLANTDPVDLTVPGADWLQDLDDLGSMCGDVGALAVRQQLSAGHGDTYQQYRAGQAIAIKDVPNGTYYLKIAANPFGRLVESDTTNNVSYRKIRLVGRPGHRRVVVPALGRVVEQSRLQDAMGGR